jgi:penicillin-binding protein 1B
MPSDKMPANKITATKSSSRKSPSRKPAPAAPQRSLLSRLLFNKNTFIAAAIGLLAVCIYAIYLDGQVRMTFAQRAFLSPAQVYARPLQLTRGKPITAEDVLFELRMLGYRRVNNVVQAGDASLVENQVFLYARPLTMGSDKRGEQFAILTFSGANLVGLTDKSGKPLDKLILEPLLIGGIDPRQSEDRMPVSLKDVPEFLISALMTTEDRDFYSHFGISPKGVARAMFENAKAGRTVQGGSTITQQLVKNVFLSNERSVVRKLNEVLMALIVDFRYSKDDILETYINEVYLGQDGSRAVHGFQLASYHYFNRPLKELSFSQQALLVGLVKGPSYYDPWRYPDRAKERRDLVLQSMREQDLMTQRAYEGSIKMRLGLARRSASEGSYPAYLALVRKQLTRDYPQEDLQTQGLRIITPLDPIVQGKAEVQAEKVLQQLDADATKQLQTAVVVTDVRNGNVLALVGDRNPRYDGFNRAIDAMRPIGSLIKPAVYLTALMRPERYSLASIINDAPITLKGATKNKPWSPRNYDRKSHGNVLLQKALAESYNQATARLGMEVGINSVITSLNKLGNERDVPAVASTFLGAVEMTPLDVAVMYQTIAAGGERRNLRAITEVTNRDGVALTHYPERSQQTLDAKAVYLLQHAMQQVMRSGTAESAYQVLSPDFTVAGKTGTSNDSRDSWFAGFSGDLVAVVWMGRDDNEVTKLTGATGALKLWRNLIKDASYIPLFTEAPAGIEYAWINPTTGTLGSEGCNGAVLIPFIEGSQPEQRDTCQNSLMDVIDEPVNWFKQLVQ